MLSGEIITACSWYTFLVDSGTEEITSRRKCELSTRDAFWVDVGPSTLHLSLQDKFYCCHFVSV